LVTDDNIGGFAEQVRDFAFSFVAPLGTNYYYVSQGLVWVMRVYTIGNYELLRESLSINPTGF
jgi:hypothetical protein